MVLSSSVSVGGGWSSDLFVLLLSLSSCSDGPMYCVRIQRESNSSFSFLSRSNWFDGTTSSSVSVSSLKFTVSLGSCCFTALPFPLWLLEEEEVPTTYSMRFPPESCGELFAMTRRLGVALLLCGRGWLLVVRLELEASASAWLSLLLLLLLLFISVVGSVWSGLDGDSVN